MTAPEARVQVFLGKGGVGKTTCAAATALAFADGGDDCLLVSTDPTPSLSHIFELTGSARERPVVAHLFVTELGLAEVRAMWDERFGRELYQVFSAFVDIAYDAFVEFVTSVLPGLNEEFMVDQIRRLALEERYRRIVWDTAPLGQTLALLETPALLAEHLRTAPRVYAHLRTSGERRESVMAVLARWAELAAACITFLRTRVSFSMVTIPEALAVRQLDGVFAELSGHGLAVNRVIVNNVVRAPDSPFLQQKATEQQPHLAWLGRRWAGVPVVEVPLFPYEIRGPERLRAVASALQPRRAPPMA